MARPETQMWLWALCVFLCCLCGASASDGPQYLVSLPAILEAGAETQICATLLNPNESLTLEGTLRSKNQNLTIVKEVSALDFQICAKFQVPPGDEEEAFLEVDVKGETFHSTQVRKVLIRTYEPLTFVQTDRPIYLPGQTVKFRVVTLDTKFRPVVQQYDRIDILHSDNKELEQWVNKTSDGRILELSFDLNSQVEVGEYRIIVSIGCQEINQSFSVQKYALPEFEVTIQAPDEISIGQDDVIVDVCAKYPFNQPVPGIISTELCRPLNVYRPFPVIKTPCFAEIKQADKAGCGSFVIPTSIFKTLHEDLLRNFLLFNTKVVEEGTGITYKGKKRISINLAVGSLTFVEVPEYYQPGSDVAGKVKAVHYNNTPFADLPVHLFEGGQLIQNLTTDSEGLAEFSFSPADSKEDILQASAELELRPPNYRYKDAYIEEGNYILHVKEDKKPVSSLAVQEKLEPLPCDKDEEVSVDYTVVGEPAGFANVFYLLLARGAIIQQESAKFEVSDQPVTEGVLNLKLRVSPDNSPVVQLVVYAILPSGAVIANSADFSTEECYNNKVSLDFSPSSAITGEENTLQISALPDSLCGISVVDQSVIKKDSSGILDDERIFDLLPVTKAPKVPSYLRDEEKCLPVRPKRHILPEIEPSGDVYSVFKNLGLKVASNLDIKIPSCLKLDNREYTFNPDGEGATLLKTCDKSGRPKETVKFLFPETWLWDVVDLGEAGAKNISVKVPDTVTTWESEAFCLSPQGFGLAHRETLDVSQPFSLQLSLPDSVTSGENFELTATAYKYQSSCIRVEVNPVASFDYDLVRKQPDEDYSTCLCGGERKVFAWTLTPKKIGDLSVTVSAEAVASHLTCHGEGVIVPKQGNINTVVKSFKVKPEGVKRHETYNWRLCPKDESLFAEVDISARDSVIEGSSKAHVSVVGDIPARVLHNLDGLQNTPYGNGESNLAILTPKIYILQYLESTNQLTPEIRKKLIKNLSSSYQRQLRYTLPSGAFGTFESGSENTWLTASALKAFNKANEYIFIDQDVTDKAQKWLDKNQKKNGCFSQKGKFFNRAVLGNVTENVIVTAYVTASFLETNRTVTSSIAESLLCLNRSIEDLRNTYATALQAYTFTLAGDTETRNRLLKHLDEVAIKKAGYIHWSQSGEDTSHALDVEITAYVLLAVISGSPTDEELAGARKIAGWLNKQQNYHGGFYATQDTVVALQALTLYSSLVFSPEGLSTVSINTPREPLSFDVTQDKLKYQEETLRDITGNFRVEVKGTACASAQISHHFNIPPPRTFKSLEVLVYTSGSCSGFVYRPSTTVTVRGRYIGDAIISNAVILDFQLLSGFIPEQKSLKELEKDSRVEQVDYYGDHVLVYIAEFLKGEILQYQLTLIQEHPVSDLRPAVVKLYDYFQPNNIGQESYVYPCLSAEA